jgi:REP element-mobilizing transposase RayT
MHHEYHPHFFTATINKWQFVLESNEIKNIIINSLQFMVKDKRVKVFAFVIMNNHMHILWQINPPHILQNVQRDFLKFTGQKIKFYLVDNNMPIINELIVNHHDRLYKIWQSNSFSIELWSQSVFLQKMEYIHYNPVRAGLCSIPEDYKYSSASYYELNYSEWDFITHYDE